MAIIGQTEERVDYANMDRSEDLKLTGLIHRVGCVALIGLADFEVITGQVRYLDEAHYLEMWNSTGELSRQDDKEMNTNSKEDLMSSINWGNDYSEGNRLVERRVTNRNSPMQDETLLGNRESVRWKWRMISRKTTYR